MRDAVDCSCELEVCSVQLAVWRSVRAERKAAEEAEAKAKAGPFTALPAHGCRFHGLI